MLNCWRLNHHVCEHSPCGYESKPWYPDGTQSYSWLMDGCFPKKYGNNISIPIWMCIPKKYDNNYENKVLTRPHMASLNHSNQLTANTVVPLSTHHFINYSIPLIIQIYIYIYIYIANQYPKYSTTINCSMLYNLQYYYQLLSSSKKNYRSPPTIIPSTAFLKINWIIIITFPFPISIAISYHIPSGKLT